MNCQRRGTSAKIDERLRLHGVYVRQLLALGLDPELASRQAFDRVEKLRFFYRNGKVFTRRA